MIVFPIALFWVAYSIGSYGIVLIRGWDITISEWVNPLKGYTWPADGSAPATIPAGQLLPGVAVGAAAGGTTANPTSPQIGGTSGTSKPVNGKCPPGNTYDPVTKLCLGPAAD
jgi:hypothetical protein